MSEGNEASAPLITLEQAKELVELLEAGMQEEADKKFTELASVCNQEVYKEVGLLTRELHNAVVDFALDQRMRSIADVEFPDATERLRYIITMTAKAANRTLDAVDACSPMVSSLRNSIEELLPIWDRLMSGDIEKLDFLSLCHKIDALLYKANDDSVQLSNLFNDIVVAQDYQDLTGQMLQKVISLVQEVEDKLVQFLLNFSDMAEQQQQVNCERDIVAEGPALDRHRQANTVASSQDEVDDLLASLGF